MKKVVKLFLITSVIISGCKDQLQNQDLVGEWRVFEYGYSPGAGYIIEEVPSEPLQQMSFGADGSFSSNYQGYDSYTSYQLIVEDEERLLLTLKKGKSDEATYQVIIDNDTAKLSYRYCIEGCHTGITRQ